MFCPKCGSLMMPKRTKDGTKLVCINCGYVMDIDENVKKEYVIKIDEKEKHDTLILVDDEEEVKDIDNSVVCPKCGKKGAYYKENYDLSSDKGFTIYKCIHCGYVWREDD